MYNLALPGNQSQYFIKYQPLKGLDLATTLMVSQLEYWFSRQTKKQKFYKFIEPCDHRLYRTGDSWCEEIGITAGVFRRSFKKIAVAYKSYRQYKEAQDTFQGKPYASYYNRQTHQTFFIKNYDYDVQGHKNRDQKNLPKKAKSPQSSRASDDARKDSCQIIDEQFTYSDKNLSANIVDLNTKNDSSNTITIHEDNHPCFIKENNEVPEEINAPSDKQKLPLGDVDISKNAVYRKLHNEVSLTRACTYQKIHSISLRKKEYVENLKIKKKLGKEKPKLTPEQQSQKRLKRTLANRMIEIWQHNVGNAHLKFKANQLLINLYNILESHFEDSLLQWQMYCKKIASSKFLMGEGKAWRFKQGVCLIWAIKAENVTKINSNAFSLGDRTIPLSAQRSKMVAERFEVMQEIKACQEKLATVHSDIQRQRRSAVRERIEDLFAHSQSSELEAYQQQFEAMLEQGNIAQEAEWIYRRCSAYFRGQEWRQMSPESNGCNNLWWYFRIYLTQLFADEHFKQSQHQMIEDEQQKIEHALKLLQQKLDQMNNINVGKLLLAIGNI